MGGALQIGQCGVEEGETVRRDWGQRGDWVEVRGERQQITESR